LVAAPYLAAAAAWLAAATTGCGGDGPPRDSPCPEIALLGTTITQVQATGSPPTPMGGTVADGIYVLTKEEAFPPVVANPPFHRSETIQLTGTEMRAIVVSDSIPTAFTATATFTTAGTQSTIDWVCGSRGTSTQGYTATDTALVLISPPGSVSTFTKQ
jgi:hypothetical protein